ncbi:MAG: hypothetical protein JXJ04_06305 [Spirochaetales bacterium]|nr:hypothetical protein [Spirochaetales bacterium]
MLRLSMDTTFQKYTALSNLEDPQRAELYRSVLVRVDVTAIFIARFSAGVYGD